MPDLTDGSGVARQLEAVFDGVLVANQRTEGIHIGVLHRLFAGSAGLPPLRRRVLPTSCKRLQLITGETRTKVWRDEKKFSNRCRNSSSWLGESVPLGLVNESPGSGWLADSITAIANR